MFCGRAVYRGLKIFVEFFPKRGYKRTWKLDLYWTLHFCLRFICSVFVCVCSECTKRQTGSVLDVGVSCDILGTRPNHAFYFFCQSFFPPSGVKRIRTKEDLVLFLSSSSGKKHCCVTAGSARWWDRGRHEDHTKTHGALIDGKYWGWKRRCGGGRCYFLITSSLSLSARCFLFWSFFRSSADASWWQESRTLRRQEQKMSKENSEKKKERSKIGRKFGHKWFFFTSTTFHSEDIKYWTKICWLKWQRK